MTVSAHTISRYQRMIARSFPDFVAFSNGVDALTEAHAQHKAHCKAAANRVDQALKDLGK